MPIRPSPSVLDGTMAKDKDIDRPPNVNAGLHREQDEGNHSTGATATGPPGSAQAQVQATTLATLPPETLNSSVASLSPNSPPPPGDSSLPGSPNELVAQPDAPHPAPDSVAGSDAPKQGIIRVGGIDFHHPSEAEFARLLNYYGLEWEYEPHQFPLQWREGRPTEMFRPDFYLTEYDFYIELTTMRQALVRRKNRKLRLLRALYPEISIKLLYRRDYQRLLERFGIKPDELLAEGPPSEAEAHDEQAAEATI